MSIIQINTSMVIVKTSAVKRVARASSASSSRARGDVARGALVTVVPQKVRRRTFLERLADQFVLIFKHAAGSMVLVSCVLIAFVLYLDHSAEGAGSILSKLIAELQKISFLKKFADWVNTNPQKFLATIMHVGVFWGLKGESKRFVFIGIATFATLVCGSFLEIALVDLCVYTFVNIGDLEIRLATIVAAVLGWLIFK